MAQFKLIICSCLICYLCNNIISQAQNVPVYLYFASHNETNDITYHGLDYADAADYATMRGYVKQVCDTIMAYNARYEMMLESNFILGCLQNESAHTNPDDLIEWADNTAQIEIQPHNHFKPFGFGANPYNYADLCHLLDSCGLSSTSEVMGGFIWRNFTSPPVNQDWTQWQTPQPGFTFPFYSWKPTLLWGGGSPNHIDDYDAYGIWKPQAATIAGFGIHNPTGALVNFGSGCSEDFILWDTTNVALLANRILNFADSVNLHFAGNANAFFCMKVMMNFRNFPSPGYAAKVGQLIRLIQPDVCNGVLHWQGIMETYTQWLAAHPNPNDYYLSRCENTVAISNAPNTATYTITLNGPDSVCANTPQTYTVNNPAAGSTYIWTITGNYTIVSGCGSNNSSCTLQWTGGTAGTVSVTQSTL
ncbi:hypothetical protein C7N43_27910 [Sphingobacteriales bacterium UPWRP_1]|nr:hypothetical protein BVG80_04705 [Sphingobacteriales bacterium TSM_CSM]PSJ73688.1 hypothetical protein C7N43_27910 [Sphingobacteriales bacterium UPWRP_1]